MVHQPKGFQKAGTLLFLTPQLWIGRTAWPPQLIYMGSEQLNSESHISLVSKMPGAITPVNISNYYLFSQKSNVIPTFRGFSVD